MRSCQRFAAPLVVRVLGQEVSAPLPAVVLSAVRADRLQLYRRSCAAPDLQRCSSLLGMPRHPSVLHAASCAPVS